MMRETAQEKAQMQGARVLRNEVYFQYSAMTKDEAEHRRWAFCEAVVG